MSRSIHLSNDQVDYLVEQAPVELEFIDVRSYPKDGYSTDECLAFTFSDDPVYFGMALARMCVTLVEDADEHTPITAQDAAALVERMRHVRTDSIGRHTLAYFPLVLVDPSLAIDGNDV